MFQYKNYLYYKKYKEAENNILKFDNHKQLLI